MDKCPAHSGLEKDIENIQTNVNMLWKKWDTLQKWIFVIIGGVFANLLYSVFTGAK